MNETIFERYGAARSHWHATVPEDEWPAPAPLPERVRFAFVGAGLAGVSIAFALVEAGVPAEEIVLLEGAFAGSAASGRNGGFVISMPGPEMLDWARFYGHDAARTIVHANIANREWVRGFVEKHGVWHQRGGSWFSAADEREVEDVRLTKQLFAEFGAEGYEHHPQAPGPKAGFLESLHQPRDIGIHPVRYIAALLRVAGLRVVRECVVERNGYRTSDGGVEIATTKGRLRAETLILTTNAHAPLYFDELTKPCPTRHKRNQVILAQPKGETSNRLWGDAMVYAREGYDYWRQFPDGSILLGGGRDKDAPGEESIEPQPNAKALAYLEGDLMPRLTGGLPFTVLRRWQGTMGYSPDGLPVVGTLPGADRRIFFAGGYSGYGLGLHRAVAETMRDALLAGDDFGVFSAARLETLPPNTRV